MSKLEKQIASVKASLGIEDLYLTEHMEELLIKESKGEISFEEYKKELLKVAKGNG
ncbi:antitoxin VbhA family protein [Cytobacillus gottheilii]|uniref:Antitoxin VbhA domain-containing protein n=1 Tax=Cytobacillus gottheilii TaxID=859144 RepID=A0ABX8FIX6_9BACI|nr:antitoxin VbhA family protein [Cytobacillus gottheilii]QVY63966.1 hypothetical protein J1899_22270 [Cytobacillus gottheilii]